MNTVSLTKYKAFSTYNFREIPQLSKLSNEQLEEIEIVAQVLPFKTNNYIINHLIDWNNYQTDPLFILTFPNKQMLLPEAYAKMEQLVKAKAHKNEITVLANEIRHRMNPHPAGQTDLNVPTIHGHKLWGVQHKYEETILFFPSKGQTCHAYCTFCFRWPQFVGMNELKILSSETQLVIDYIKMHPKVTDIIFTGGDPLMMNTAVLASYLEPLIEAKIPHLKAIRIGTKSLAFWPHRYTTDHDADALFELFKKVKKSGIHLALMAHFSHPVELSTPEVQKAIKRLVRAGIQIRTQSPLLNHINNSADIWAELWQTQVNLGLIPYYMFVSRDTGTQPYFAVPLVKAWEIFKDALQHVSGIVRTVRGPSMSCIPGKVEVVGVSHVNKKKVIVLRMIQGRNPAWVLKPFFAEYDDKAIWIDTLKPAFDDAQFFFEQELEEEIFHKFISDH